MSGGKQLSCFFYPSPSDICCRRHPEKFFGQGIKLPPAYPEKVAQTVNGKGLCQVFVYIIRYPERQIAVIAADHFAYPQVAGAGFHKFRRREYLFRILHCKFLHCGGGFPEKGGSVRGYLFLCGFPPAVNKLSEHNISESNTAVSERKYRLSKTRMAGVNV